VNEADNFCFGFPSATMKMIFSSDRSLWQVAHTKRMIILTSNRNMKGDDSLEQVIREDSTLTLLPVVTIGNKERLRE
jgi:hypothetical protein